MTTITWAEVRAHTTALFHGQQPRPADEQAIADHFEQHPLMTIYATRDIAEALNAGRCKHGWSTLATHLTRPAADITIDMHVTPPAVHECPHCGLRFASATRLTEHHENIHLELQETPPPTNLTTALTSTP